MKNDILYALTIYQPWATLIIRGAKPLEFRSYSLSSKTIGCRVVIHAAAKALNIKETQDLLANLMAGGERAARTCLKPEIAIPVLKEILFEAGRGGSCKSVGLGTATMGPPIRGKAIADMFGYQHVGNDLDSNWGWPMEDIEVWKEPVHSRGFQGLWHWKEDIGSA